MSRIGRMPIPVPAGVEIQVAEDNTVTVKGPKGTLTQKFCPEMKVGKSDDGTWGVTRPNDAKENRSLHGLTRTLLNNMVVGVTAGFTKDLEINGVGYRAQLQGKQLVMNLGYSHPVTMDPPSGITIAVPAPNKVSVTGCDKQAVGQFAANIRKQRPPEPYKGKGIRYADEYVRRKEGKTGAKKK